MKYNTMLKLEDFQDDSFIKMHKDIFAHCYSDLANYPTNQETAKAWEITLSARALKDFGALHPNSELLGVAAGFEHTAFWLTNHAKRVFVTDLYLVNRHWTEADSGMLTNPGQFAVHSLKWQPRRMVVQHMNALDLLYEDNSFDGVFSCGSIEHFGSLENVSVAMAEVGRVLKPGGVAVIATEFRISGPEGIGVPGSMVFTPDMIMSSVVEASGLTLVDTPDWTTSAATIQAAYPLNEAIERGVRSRSVAVIQLGYTWTSGLICLRKN